MTEPQDSRATVTYFVPAAERQRLREDLTKASAAELPAGPYEAWRARWRQATAILYESGKLVISGPAPAFEDLRAIVESVPGVALRTKNPAKPNPSPPPGTSVPEQEPHIGTDEAGKGDFFGPLVTAGVYVDARSAEILRVLGVRDSKTIQDRALRALAGQIRQVSAARAAITVVAPRRYNELYKQMRSEGKNLNTLLAWTHTRVIEDLMKAGVRPKFILSDQFGDKRYIEQRLLVETRQSGIPLIQMPRAEADVAVAAASILARDAFLGWLERASKAVGVKLPKGASPQVIETAKLLVQRSGREILNDYAKTSFKTMAKVIGPG
ncbi:MAG TPA: ribonuclease HIII [Candidatus Limnocylindria bacterium]|nr:ribonuclease HIII [Candidatus Limnocylindria bacterium]